MGDYCLVIEFAWPDSNILLKRCTRLCSVQVITHITLDTLTDRISFLLLRIKRCRCGLMVATVVRKHWDRGQNSGNTHLLTQPIAVNRYLWLSIISNYYSPDTYSCLHEIIKTPHRHEHIYYMETNSTIKFYNVPSLILLL